MSSDALHDLKTSFGAPNMGISEKLEGTAKGFTREMGLEPISRKTENLASKFAVLMEYYGLARIVRHKAITIEEGMTRHEFFFDDKIINAALVLGSAAAVISNFDLLLPIAAVWAFYFGSDKFIKNLEKL